MITEEKEEKIIKSLGIIILLCAMPLMILLKNDFIKSCIVIPLVLIMSVLYFRKYKRDVRDGKDLSRYKRLLFFIIVSLLITIVFIVLPK